MTAYEIIMILIEILILLISFGSSIIVLLAFLDKRYKRTSKYDKHILLVIATVAE